MSFRTEPCVIVECDNIVCFEEFVAPVGITEHDALVESGFSTGEDGKHYCDACLEAPRDACDEEVNRG